MESKHTAASNFRYFFLLFLDVSTHIWRIRFLVNILAIYQDTLGSSFFCVPCLAWKNISRYGCHVFVRLHLRCLLVQKISMPTPRMVTGNSNFQGSGVSIANLEIPGWRVAQTRQPSLVKVGIFSRTTHCIIFNFTVDSNSSNRSDV